VRRQFLRVADVRYGKRLQRFTPDVKLRTGVNQAECRACHKPLDKASFLFSLEPLTKVAKAR